MGASYICLVKVVLTLCHPPDRARFPDGVQHVLVRTVERFVNKKLRATHKSS